MTGTTLRWLACLVAALGAQLLGADGIALSTDGLIWTKGAGSYGEGWGYTGTGVSVDQGGTLYIKYFSSGRGAVLSFADHGRKLEGWQPIGPVLADDIGADASTPVILRISEIGTPQSTVSWINGRGKSGIWSGPPTPGPYDLALGPDARWTLPPIVVTEAPGRPSFWARLFGPGGGSGRPDPGDKPIPVPDDCNSVGLLAVALATLVWAARRLN